jgi:hypothetical protein
MAWDEGQTLAVRFEHACRAAAEVHPHWRLGTSYSGFADALARQAPLIGALKARFRRRMRDRFAGHWSRGRWAAFAVDGPRIEAPPTAANEAGLGRAGRDKAGPQASLTVLWHIGTGLPWDYRAAPVAQGERTHMRRMVGSLPPGSLVVADAGFVGYGLCLRLLRHGQHFLLRIGGHVSLLEGLGYYHEERDGLVYLWPHKHRKGRPLVLRRIVLRRGLQEVHLLTDVLDAAELSEAEAGDLFGLRWGEEVFFRSFKQTMQHRRLLSRTGATSLAEAEWSVLGLWLLGLMTAERLVADGAGPHEMSVAGARDVVRGAMSGERPRRGPETVRAGLGAARKDGYQRQGNKEARDYPRKDRQKPPGPPKIKAATAAEVERAQKLPPPEIPKQWTA